MTFTPLTHTATPSRPTPVFVPDEILDRLMKVSSGSLTTQLFKKGFRQTVLVGLKPVSTANKPFAGRAYTMRFIPAREDIDTYATLTTEPHHNNLQWVGVEQISPGEVIVIDSNRDPRAASMGNMLATRMMLRGARGLVTDGSLRDGNELAALDFPSWSASVTSTTRLSYHHVADLQVPIGCAGVAVYPGDVIHSDGNNITVIPAHCAREMADLCEPQDDMEAYLAQRLQRGEALWGLYPPSAQTRVDYAEWIAAGKPTL
jgi:regulator of RNase E activity RraA